MDHYTHNLNLIQKLRPDLYDSLRSYLTVQGPSLRQDSEGFYNLIWNVSGGIKKLYDRTVTQEYERSLNLIKPKHPRILIFDGIGLGYHIFEFLRSRPKAIRDIIIIEKDPFVFLSALKIHDFSSLIVSEDFKFFVGLDKSLMVPTMMEYWLARSRLLYSDRCDHFYFLPALESDGDYYLNFSKAMKASVEGLYASYAAPVEDNFRGLLNIVKNAQFFPQSVALQRFSGVFEGKPGIVVAAGPSLDQHLTYLHKNQDKFVIVSSDGALKTLIKNGIQPHFVCSMERDLETRELFKDVPKDYNIPLITQPIIHPQVYEFYPGPVVMICRECSFGKWVFPSLSQYFLGLSVAHMAYRSLALLGCSKIYLLGQDLARDRGSLKTHTGEVAEIQQKYTQKLLSESTYCEVEGNDGTPIASTIFWRLFIADYEYLIAQMKIPCGNVIKKEQGAKIPGAILIDPDDFWRQANDFLPFEGHQIIKEILGTAPKLDGKNLGSYSDLFKRTIQYLSDVESACLSLLDDMSLTYLEHSPSVGSQHDLERYERYFSLWEKKWEEIIAIDESLFSDFLFCLTSSKYIRALSSREALSRDNNLDYINKYIETTQDWLSAFHLWICRSRHLLEKQV